MARWHRATLLHRFFFFFCGRMARSGHPAWCHRAILLTVPSEFHDGGGRAAWPCHAAWAAHATFLPPPNCTFHVLFFLFFLFFPKSDKTGVASQEALVLGLEPDHRRLLSRRNIREIARNTSRMRLTRDVLLESRAIYFERAGSLGANLDGPVGIDSYHLKGARPP